MLIWDPGVALKAPFKGTLPVSCLASMFLLLNCLLPINAKQSTQLALSCHFCFFDGCMKFSSHRSLLYYRSLLCYEDTFRMRSKVDI